MSWESQLIALLSASLLRPFALVAAAWLVLRLFRVRHPASRHAVWSVVLAALVLLPLVSVSTPHWKLPLLPRKNESAALLLTAWDAAQGLVQTVEPTEAPPELSQTVTPRPVFRMPSPRTLVIGCYLAGLLAILLYRAAGWVVLRRFVARSVPVRGTALRESREVVTPIVVGVLRPAVILPFGWRAWNSRTRRTVLAHEFAHIRRKDTLISALGRLVKSLLWFHPLAWWVSRQVSQLAEQACDAVALESLRDPGCDPVCDPAGYARVLLEFASEVNRAGYRAALPGLAMAAASSEMGNRIDQLFELSRGDARKLTRPGALLAFVGLPVMGLAATVGLGEWNGRSSSQQLPPVVLPPNVSPKAVPPAREFIAQAPAPAQARPVVPEPPKPAVAPVDAKLEFEVASVRALAPVAANTNGGFRVSGGPGTEDPERIRYTQAAIFQILARTFLMQDDQFIGPDWVTQRFGAERFEIIANVPPGATQQQVSVMMQNLLKERFHLAFHREKKSLDVYELVVAKGGSKLKDAEIPGELPVPPRGQPAKAYKGDDGYPNPPAGWPEGVGVDERSSMQFFFSIGCCGFRLASPGPLFPAFGKLAIWRFGIRMITIPQFMDWIQSFQGIAHMVDHTGLTGKYDVKLRFSNGGTSGDGDASDPAPDIFEALEKQLGLKLQKTKAALDVIVIDHIDRTPVEN